MQLPWPQYCDGDRTAGPMAQQFGVTGIPAKFLLDREGRLASLSAGQGMEEQIKKLLEMRN